MHGGLTDRAGVLFSRRVDVTSLGCNVKRAQTLRALSMPGGVIIARARGDHPRVTRALTDHAHPYFSTKIWCIFH